MFVSGFRGALASGNFSIAPAEILDSNVLSVICHNIVTNFTLSLSATQIIHGQEIMLVLPDQRLSCRFSMSVPCFVSCLPV